MPAGPHGGVTRSPFDWTPDPAPLTGLLVVGLLYFWAVGPGRGVLAPEAPFPRRQAACFLAALGILYLALCTPLDAIGERYLFSVHMLQHNLLMYPVPVLLLLSTPEWLIRPLFEVAGVAAAGRWLTHPAAALILPNVVFAGWHFPPLYEWALRSRFIHLLEHLTMIGSCLLLWWPRFSPSPAVPRYSYGGQMLYIFVQSVAQMPLFFFLTFAGETYYPTYEQAVRLTSLTPIQDQQLGGVVMKVSAMVVFGAGLLVAFWRWYEAEEGRPRRAGAAAGGAQPPALNLGARASR